MTGKGGKERGEKRKEKGKGREREDQARQGCKCLFDLFSMTFTTSYHVVSSFLHWGIFSSNIYFPLQ